jgi:alpha-methylacyl-CoA racemase
MTHSFLNAGFWREERGVNILDTGAHFYEVYETSDEKFVAVGAIEPKFYAELLEGLGLDAATLPGQMERDQWPELKERLASVFRSKTRDEWTAIFENTDACVTPVLSPSEAARHRYNVERQVYSIEGTVQPNPAPRFSKTPSTVTMAPQTPGSGTSEGLAGWGISEERRADLKAGGAFGQI